MRDLGCRRGGSADFAVWNTRVGAGCGAYRSAESRPDGAGGVREVLQPGLRWRAATVQRGEQGPSAGTHGVGLHPDGDDFQGVVPPGSAGYDVLRTRQFSVVEAGCAGVAAGEGDDRWSDDQGGGDVRPADRT